MSHLKLKISTLLASLLFAVVLVAAAGNWQRAVTATLVHEGGASYTNHPADPGGPTKYGITIHDVRRFMKKGASAQDVKNLTQSQAIAIYKAHYWDAIGGDALPAGLDYAVFDYAVNAGTGRAIPVMRRCIAKHPDDVPGQIRCVCDERYDFQINQLGSRFNVFKRGWANRIRSVRAGALSMAGVDKALLGDDMIPRVGPGKAYDFTPED